MDFLAQGFCASRSSGRFQAWTKNKGGICGPVRDPYRNIYPHRFLFYEEKVEIGEFFLHKIERVLGSRTI
jgi:hypothetical protein